MTDYRADRAKARGGYNITWGIVRGRKIHVACAEPEEATMCWAGFHGPRHDNASDPCERCGLPLNQTPDP